MLLSLTNFCLLITIHHIDINLFFSDNKLILLGSHVKMNSNGFLPAYDNKIYYKLKVLLYQVLTNIPLNKILLKPCLSNLGKEFLLDPILENLSSILNLTLYLRKGTKIGMRRL